MRAVCLLAWLPCCLYCHQTQPAAAAEGSELPLRPLHPFPQVIAAAAAQPSPTPTAAASASHLGQAARALPVALPLVQLKVVHLGKVAENIAQQHLQPGTQGGHCRAGKPGSQRMGKISASPLRVSPSSTCSQARRDGIAGQAGKEFILHHC